MGVIEAARSGRSSCKLCREPIPRDALRFGEDAFGAEFEGDTMIWFHFDCAAKNRPHKLHAALLRYQGEVPNRETLLADLAVAGHDARLAQILRAELAPSAQATCIQCNTKIERSRLRLAVEVDVAMTKSTSYLHLACAKAWTRDHAGLPKRLATLFESLPNTTCPECAHAPLSYVDPEAQLACAKCGGMFELGVVDSRRKPASAPKKT